MQYTDPQVKSPYSNLDIIFNSSISRPNFCGYIPQTEWAPKPPKGFDSLDTLDPAQLGRYLTPPHYVLGYADPAFSGGEYTRGLSFHDYKAREELYRLKHDDLPLVYDEDSTVTNFKPQELMSSIDDPETEGTMNSIAAQSERVYTLTQGKSLRADPTTMLQTPSPYNGSQTMSEFNDSAVEPDVSKYRNEYINVESKSPKMYYNYLAKPTATVPYSDVPLYPQLNFIETQNPHHEHNWSKVNPSETFMPNNGRTLGSKSSASKVSSHSMSTGGSKASKGPVERFIPSNLDNVPPKLRMEAMTIGLPVSMKSAVKEPYTLDQLSNINISPQRSNISQISTNSVHSQPNSIPKYDTRDSDINLNKRIDFNIHNSTATSESLVKNSRFESNMETYLPRFRSETYTPSNPDVFETPSDVPMTSTTPSVSNDPDDLKPFANEQYLDALKTRAMALCYYLQNNPAYQNWKRNWKLLERNLGKTNLDFNKLSDNDEDIAYVINKGDEISFRIHDLQKYVPINVYQYVLYHEMAHMSTEELQHTDFFHELLNIISLAAYELGFIDLRRISFSYYNTNNQPILSKDSLKQELIEGCYFVGNASGRKLYYDKLAKHIKSF